MVSYTRDLNSYRERAAASHPGLPWLALLLLFAVPLVSVCTSSTSPFRSIWTRRNGRFPPEAC